MPPITRWYLLTKSKVEEDNQSTFQKFFDLDRISEALNTISMEQFILTVAAKGLLKEMPPADMSVTEQKVSGGDVLRFLFYHRFLRCSFISTNMLIHMNCVHYFY